MVGVTRQVIAATTVNRPLFGYAEEILAIAFVDNLVRHTRAGILDDLLAFGNALRSEQPEAGG